MNTYWFTSAVGGKFVTFAKELRQSAKLLGIDLHILGEGCSGPEQAKHVKIDGVLNAPEGYDKIAFVDADSLLVNVDGVDAINGSLLCDWGVPLGSYSVKQHQTPETIRRRLDSLREVVNSKGLSEIWQEGDDEKYHYVNCEWSSGVIIGDRQFMVDLMTAWDWWWKRVNECNDGEFYRDQISFKFAYYEIGVKKYGYETIPKSWNWLIKRWSFPPNVNILHKSGKPNGGMCYKWDLIKQDVLSRKHQYRGIIPVLPVIDKYRTTKVRLGHVLMDLFGDRPIVGVEVGACRGDNCKLMLENHPKLTLTGIDMWDLHVKEGNVAYLNTTCRDSNAKRMRDVNTASAMEAECIQKVSPFADRCHIVKMSSEKAAMTVEDKSLDFAYIDADHSYEGCKRDLNAWWPKVKAGGYICGHDYACSRLRGVTDAVDEFRKRENLPLIHTHNTYADWILGPKVTGIYK